MNSGKSTSILRNYVNRQVWNAKRFGLTPDKLLARASISSASKILCVSVPKSGTHLLERAICLHPKIHRPLIRTLNDDNLKQHGGMPVVLNKLARGEAIFSHLAYRDLYQEKIKSNNVRVLFQIRDPRDIVVSRVFFVMKNQNHPLYEIYSKQETFRDRLIISISGTPEHNYEDSMSSILERFSGWLSTEAKVVRFEKLIGSEGGGSLVEQAAILSDIFHYLDVWQSQECLNKICRQVFSTASPTFRKGAIGGWKNHFDPEMKRLFKRRVGKQLIRYGYEIDEEW